MGQSVACAARVDGREDRGTALLETDEVIFRGERSRARVTFASIRSMAVTGDRLAIVHAKGALDLSLGKRAAEWLAKIRKPKGIVEKLAVKAGARVAIVALDDAALAKGLADAGANVREAAPRSEVNVIVFGVKKESDLARVGPLLSKLARDGALWIVRPKGKTGVAEGAVRDAAIRAGLVDVKVARYSDTHTAEKFVVPLAKR